MDPRRTKPRIFATPKARLRTRAQSGTRSTVSRSVPCSRRPRTSPQAHLGCSRHLRRRPPSRSSPGLPPEGIGSRPIRRDRTESSRPSPGAPPDSCRPEAAPAVCRSAAHGNFPPSSTSRIGPRRSRRPRIGEQRKHRTQGTRRRQEQTVILLKRSSTDGVERTNLAACRVRGHSL